MATPKQIVWTLLLALVGLNAARAQRHEVLTDHVRTLRVVVGDQWNASPLLHLGGGDRMEISFDDLTHEYRRYRYRVEACNFDWTTNEGLFESDYLRGETGEQTIETFRKSLNTNMLYTHYTFTFPNERVGISLSGNYRIHIYDDDEEEDVALVCFSVVKEAVQISASVSTNTDIDQDREHQQLRFSVNAQNLRMTNPTKELKTVVLQNDRWDNAVVNPKPDFLTPNDLQWRYDKRLIFKAGNEYRKFEITNLRVPTLGVNKLRWFDPYYHAELYEGKRRVNYLYDEDQNGKYLVRSEEYDDADIQADYVLVHFTLKAEPLVEGDYYVMGDFSLQRFLPECKMEYQDDREAYEATVLLKQGYYNYLYLHVDDPEEAGTTAEAEGDFYQTENKYSILVYFRPPGGRYDQLVGVREMRFISGK